jgi:hypothetical protein
MPLDAGGEKSKISSKKEAFHKFLAELEKLDFSSIVRYLQREDKNHWTEEKALSELENFKAFLALRNIVKFSIVPTKDIDEVWHACILHTEFYVDMCTSLFGKYIHHRPSDGTPETKQKSRSNFERTADLFSKMTGRQYIADTHGTKCCPGCGKVVAKSGTLVEKVDSNFSCGSYCSTCDCY